jgi:RNA polymerase sigma-70 factor (ECF subfamily)
VRGRVPDAALAEDLTSETFARAFAKIESFSFQGKDFRAWLCTIARNLVIDHGRSKYARTLLVGDYEPGWEQAAPVDVESVVVRGHIVADLCRRLEDLTEGQRECLRLRFALDYSVAETAAVMKRDIRAVRQLQHRAVLRLGSSMREAWA